MSHISQPIAHTSANYSTLVVCHCKAGQSDIGLVDTITIKLCRTVEEGWG